MTNKSTVTPIILALLAMLPGCTTKPALPPGVRPTVEVGPAPRSDA